VKLVTDKNTSNSYTKLVTTTCASHCGGSCILKLHVENGVIKRIETDEGEEPQLRACLKGRAYRQRVYASDRLLHPLKRIGKRGQGDFKQITWDEALDTVAKELARVRDAYGSTSILYIMMGGDLANLHTASPLAKVLGLFGGFTTIWGMTSFQGGIHAERVTYGTVNTGNTRDDLGNSRLILMWGWNPAVTITGVNTNLYLLQAKEAGAKIVVIDPRYTASASVYADQWIPIYPGTDGTMLLAMAYVMLEENLHNQRFLDNYTVGFDKFREYVLGNEDGIRKTPMWAETITGVPAATIEHLAREYATIKPAALMAGIAPGRTAYGEQYHRIAITLAAMTGNVGIHGGSSGGRVWESLVGGYPYKMPWRGAVGVRGNPVDEHLAHPPRSASPGYRASRIHFCDIPNFIEKGRAGGFPADCKLMAICNCSYVNALPNTNRVVKGLMSDNLEFIFILEQFMTPTARYADIILPTTTFLERNDICLGVGLPFYGFAKKAIEPIGESKSHYEIASMLASRLHITDFQYESEDIIDYEEFKSNSVHRIALPKPHIAFEQQIENNVHKPFSTPTGKIEIYSQQLADLDNPLLPAIPKYIEPWENRNDPLAVRFPLQLISTHSRRRANNQFENIPWLRELDNHAIWINPKDAEAREILNGDMVRVFNDRGELLITARVTERIMPGVVDIPYGAWYDPDENGIDKGGSPNILTSEKYSPGGAFPYNTCLVEVNKA
jgi:anaerobic dimethyl sulfoxide reductase subunit A